MWINRKKFEQMTAMFEQHVENLNKLKAEIDNRATLISIERTERMNVFTFVRNGEIHRIETMGLISDDVGGWKVMLGLPLIP